MTVDSIQLGRAPSREPSVFIFLLVLAFGLVTDAQAGPRGGGGGGRMAQNSVSAANRDMNHGGINGNHNTNINHNSNNNVNINRDVDIDVDHHYDHHHHGGVWAAAAITAAVVIGARYYSLPPSCTSVYRNGINYSYCGGYYYQPHYEGSSVVYVVVNP